MWNIKYVNEDKGYGMFASENIESGTIIFEEEPVISCQFSWNKLYKYVACDYCMKSLETAEAMCKRLAQNVSIALPHPECCPSKPDDVVACSNCQVLYCSTQCREKAFKEYHMTLCSGQSLCNTLSLEELDKTWREVHYPPESTSIMLIVRLIAKIKQSENKDEFLRQIESFCHQYQNESSQIAHKLLGEKFQSHLELLCSRLREVIYDPIIAHWFTNEGFSSLFALLGTNQQGIGSSALSVWVNNCYDLNIPEEQSKDLDKLIDNIYEELDNVAGDFLNCEGSGLFMNQSKINHSCSPNAEVHFLHNNHKLSLQATQDIKEGEEINISYLSECQLNRSRHSRQAYLRENYLFVCECTKCISQCADPDVTSDEDDSEEEMIE